MIFALGYLASVVGANLLLRYVGFAPVWPGVMAPAGVYLAGISFTLRDFTQERLGRRWCIGVILLGSAISALFGGSLALASGLAFLISEAADFAAYTPLRSKSLILAIVVSNTLGAALDSAIFLLLAFGSLAFFWGQFIGKGWATLLFVIPLAVYRWHRRAGAVQAQGAA